MTLGLGKGLWHSVPSVFPVAITKLKSAIKTCNSFRNIRASVGATGVIKVILTAFHRLNILSRGKRKNLNCPWGDYLDHLLGNNEGNIQIKELLWSFHQWVTGCDLNQEITWLLPFALHHPAHSRTSTAVLYGGPLCGRISCMWWWGWTAEHACRFGPLTWT